MSYNLHYVFLGLFLFGALAVPLLPIILARFVAPKKPNPVKQEAYECGMQTLGDSWVQFRIQYYLFAILFVIFDVEALFLFPWAVVFKDLQNPIVSFQSGGSAVVEGLMAMGLFLGVLALGLIYAWMEGVLEWE